MKMTMLTHPGAITSIFYKFLILRVVVTIIETTAINNLHQRKAAIFVEQESEIKFTKLKLRRGEGGRGLLKVGDLPAVVSQRF